MNSNAILEQRANALATVFLTRHKDVSVQSAPRGICHDLIVSIERKGTLSGRMFGVEIKSRLKASGFGRMVDDTHLLLSSTLRSDLESLQKSSKDLPYPLLFLALVMDTDRGFYTWLRQPVIKKQARTLSTPMLRRAELWADTTHNDVIDTVNRWYDVISIE